jgi:hypothetical protein
MPNQFKEVTTTGFGGRILNSIVGVGIGVVLFLCSFVVLYWNEGRFDFSTLAKDALPVEARDAEAPSKAGKNLVALTGTASSTEMLNDEMAVEGSKIILKSGKYLALQRNVEMYGWKEEKETKTNKNFGGSETTETTYTYKTDWIELPDAAKSKDFAHPEEHQNPVPLVTNDEKRVKTITQGLYTLKIGSLELPDYTNLTLEDQVILPRSGALKSTLWGSDYILVGKGTFQEPQVGDVRINYKVVRYPIAVTSFGRFEQTNLVPYVDKEGHLLYSMYEGTKDEAVARFHQEYTTALWIFRLVGFLMMAIGLMMFFGPLSTLLDIVPIFGSLSRTLVGIASIVAALVLSAVTILVSMVLHNIVALIIVLGVLIIGTIFWLKKMRQSKGPTKKA